MSETQIVLGNLCQGGGAVMNNSPTYLNIKLSNKITNNINITLGGEYDDAKRLRELCAACNVSENDISKLLIRAIENRYLSNEPRENSNLHKRKFLGIF